MWYPVEVYEEHYLAADDPRRQSGFGGGEERWEAARRPIVEAIHRPGSFLDVGSRERVPARVGRPLVAASDRAVRARLLGAPRREWEAPRRFDFVRTELVYAQEELRRELVERLLAPGRRAGWRLIVCGYGSPRSGVPTDPVRRILRGWAMCRSSSSPPRRRRAAARFPELAVLGVSCPDGVASGA